MILGDSVHSIDAKTFLNQHWQKKPLLIRSAFKHFKDPLSPEELAGLACEEAIESRIITNTGESWKVSNGPFQESEFTSLPKDNWTLLVQGVDPWFSGVKKLISSVAFIPSWRIDDVMVSYAEKNAGAGPHFDYYDVFIIQGQGSRLWKIGQQCNSLTKLNTESGLKTLQEFNQTDEWVLHSGDVLYIPPGLAHYGISLDSSLSYSIGFRAPSVAEMLISYSDEICASLNDDQRFADQHLSSTIKTGEIIPSVLNQVQELLQSSIANPEALGSWFGKYMTETKVPGIIDIPDVPYTAAELSSLLAKGRTLEKHPVSRTAWFMDDATLRVYADGEDFVFTSPSPLLHSLNQQFNNPTLEQLELSGHISDPVCLQLLCALVNQGTLVISEY